MVFMLPADQSWLRECMTRTSLLDELLSLSEDYQHGRLISAQRPRLPRGLRPVRAGGGTAPRWLSEAVHRGACGPISTSKASRESRPAAAAGAGCARSKCCVTCGSLPIAQISPSGTTISPSFAASSNKGIVSGRLKLPTSSARVVRCGSQIR